MTNRDRKVVKRAIDRRARKAQAWWDEYEAFLAAGPEDPIRRFCTCQEISRDPRNCAVHGEHLREVAVAA